jgi:glycosyltransferase involved in cell wall biosynthesis
MARKKAGIFSPYWDTGGGGEKYCLGVIQVLLKLDYRVEVFWQTQELTSEVSKRFKVDLQELYINEAGYRTIKSPGHLWAKLKLEKEFDLLFFVSDGAVPAMFARNNILHFQVPFQRVHGKSLANRLKMSTVQTVVCNSKFTREVIDREYGVHSHVVYPSVKPVPELEKEPYILSVGRFDNLLHSKRHDVLIEAFDKLKHNGWRLILAGGVLHGETEVEKLKAMVHDLPIIIIVNPDFETLQKLYGQAGIYWHAAGYGQDLLEHPERAEHFGISTVEAMSAKAVPIVFAGGGQVEIIEDNKNGYTWQNIEELVFKTQRLIEDSGIREQMAIQSQTRAKVFNEEVFERSFSKLIG